MPASTNETYSPAETETRREAALKTMFATPHKPHKANKKGGKESSQSKKAAKRKPVEQPE